FQALSEAGEDLIHICEKCKVAVNKEIIQEQEGKCPVCGQAELKEVKSVEVGNIFKLGTKFSEPFDLTYRDEKGERKPILMGCYGIGLQRLLGTVVEISSDDKGIIWPEEVAPFAVHLISLDQNEKAQQLYNRLCDQGVEVLFDDRTGVRAGEKFADADLIGCPWRVVVSKKTVKEGKLEVKKRSEEEVVMLSQPELLNRLGN
ncbi:MAG: prolyl-tRNA synthetase, partial [Acidobacteria bacterium]